MYDDLIFKIRQYYLCRGLKWPDKKDSILWLFTELGELVDAVLRLESGWVRNNNKDTDVASELGDCLFMLLVTSQCLGIDPIEAMLNKMEKKMRS